MTPRTRFWLVTAATAVASALTASMGVWQLSRADQKRTLEAQITQRVSELRAMFSNAFSGFGMNDLSVVNAVDEGEPSDAQSDDDAQHDDETAAPADADTQDAVENDSAAETEPEGDAESADASQNN